MMLETVKEFNEGFKGFNERQKDYLKEFFRYCDNYEPQRRE
jgi:hypothetical protein